MMKIMSVGLGGNNLNSEDRLFKNLQESLMRPHLSHSGNVTCTNPKCKARIIKSNADLEINSISHKAVMISGKTKIFILGKSFVAECICGAKYNLDDSFTLE